MNDRCAAFAGEVHAGAYAWNVRFDSVQLANAPSATPNVLGAVVTTAATAVVRIRRR